MTNPDEFRVLAPTAILGYGFPETSLKRGLELSPDLIAVDAGSIDPGPYYLGAGVSFTQARAVRRDLRLLLDACRQYRIPLFIGSAGGAGARPHVEWCVEILDALLAEMAWHCRVAVIYADMDREQVLSAARSGELLPLDGAGVCDEERIRRSPHIRRPDGRGALSKGLESRLRHHRRRPVLRSRGYRGAAHVAGL